MHIFTKMKREIIQTIKIPADINVEIEGENIVVIGPEGKNEREFNVSGLIFKKEGGEIKIGDKKATKNVKMIINTIASHINNMIKGVQEKFEYKLKICFSHFPITVEIKGNEVWIKNFLGEKVPRKMKLPIGAEVQVDKDIITVKSTDIETAGQAAANFENVTKIPNRDRRIFQDGIFITSKCGEEI